MKYMKDLNRIYLLIEHTGSWDDYNATPIGAFLDKQLAEKVANGLDDAVDKLQLKAEGLDDIIQDEDYQTEADRFWESLGMDHYSLPNYTIQELDITIIN